MKRGEQAHPKPTISAGECEICGVWRAARHKDHIIPKFMGGSNAQENIQMLCANCHQDKTLVEHPQKIASQEWKDRHHAAARAVMTDPEIQAKHRTAVQNAMQRPEVRARISAGLLGHEVSEERRSNISKALKGRTLSSEHREAISNGLKRRLR